MLLTPIAGEEEILLRIPLALLGVLGPAPKSTDVLLTRDRRLSLLDVAVESWIIEGGGISGRFEAVDMMSA